MLNEGTRVRLRKWVRRQATPTKTGSTTGRPRMQRRERPVLAVSPQVADVVGPSAPVEADILEPLVVPPRGLDAAHEITNSGGKHLLIRRDVAKLWPPFAEAWNQLRRCEARRSQETAASKTEAVYDSFLANFPQRTLFLDLETCGFAGSMIFLAGVLHWEGDVNDARLVLSQLWARSYAEERAMLTTLRGYLVGQQVLVTFNGKSFDWPQVRDRCVLHERDPSGCLPNLEHLDLLHWSRRKWKSQLPNCKLQTLEKYICGRVRTGDVPGSEIPAAYHHYVRSGDEQQVGSILYHNAFDLITLLQLALCVGDVR